MGVYFLEKSFPIPSFENKYFFPQGKHVGTERKKCLFVFYSPNWRKFFIIYTPWIKYFPYSFNPSQNKILIYMEKKKPTNPWKMDFKPQIREELATRTGEYNNRQEEWSRFVTFSLIIKKVNKSKTHRKNQTWSDHPSPSAGDYNLQLSPVSVPWPEGCCVKLSLGS